MQDEIIDKIYEASVVPELWPSLLEDLSKMTGSMGGMLFSVKDRVLSWTASTDVHDAFGAYISGGWFKRCGRRICLFEKAHSSFLTELDYWTDKELASNEIYRDFFHPRDLGWSAGTGLSIPTGDNIVCSIEKAYSTGPMENKSIALLNELRPHIARSAVISSRLGLKSAKSASDTLVNLGIPTLLLTADGSVIDMSNITEDIKSHINIGAHNKLLLSDTSANNMLALGLKELSEASHLTGKSFPIRDNILQAFMIGHLLPINRSATDIFAHGYALFALVPLTVKAIPSVDIVRSLFDFTVAEAGVARKLATGISVEQIADHLNVSVATIRTHVRKILEKTGCSKQHELVSLLSNITLTR